VTLLGCDLNRRIVMPINKRRIDIGLSIEQELDTLIAAMVRCLVQCSVRIRVLCVDVGLSIEQELDTFATTDRRRSMQWRRTERINDIDTGSSIEEYLHTSSTIVRCDMQRSIMFSILGHEIRSSIDQELDTTVVTLGHSHMKRSVLRALALGLIDIGFSIKKILDHLLLTLSHCFQEIVIQSLS